MSKILFLHGALGAASQVEDALRDKLPEGLEYDILEFDGHGSTPLAGNFGMPSFVKTLTATLKKYDVPPLVFGYSMGGYVALLAAAADRSLCSGIITLGTKVEWSPSIAERERQFAEPHNITAKVPKFAALLEQRHTALGWENLCRSTIELMQGLGANPLLAPAVLKSVAVPVIMAVGDTDETVSIDETRRAAEFLPTGRLCVLPDERHPLEKVSATSIQFLLRAMADFQKKNARKGR